jgi:hypothetical protein
MDPAEKDELLRRYSRCEVTAIEVREAFGGITYGDVIMELAQRNLPLPRAPQEGREEDIRRAKAILFPDAK